MRKLFILTVTVTLFLPLSAYALDAPVDAERRKKLDKEQRQDLKQMQEKREQKGEREAETIQRGIDRQAQEAIKAIGQAMRQSGADITLPLEAVFLDLIAQMEIDNVKPFRTCRIATEPQLPRDFGLSAEIRPGIIDTIKADYLSKAAQSNSFIRGIADEQAIRQYRNCLVQYGAIIAQAYLNLSADISNLGVSVSKDKDGNIIVRGLGYEDFINLADSALQKAIRGITNSTIKRMYSRALNDNSPCQFDRSIENIKCGSSLITLSTKPQLFVSGIEFYGQRFAGFQGAYKVSKSWSYQDAIEKLKTTSRYEKWANEVSKFAEALESQGKSKEATLVRKKAWERVESGKHTVSPSKLIPGL
jgi:hypothetical protein